MHKYHETDPGLANPRAERGFLTNIHNKLIASALAGTLAVASFAGKEAAVSPAQAEADTPTPELINPEILSQEARAVIIPTVQAWQGRQTPDGRFVDPSLGVVDAYGSGMIGQAMIETGVALNDKSFIDAGLNALSAQPKHPDDAGANLFFEIVSTTDAIATNDKLLANYPAWQTTRGELIDFVKARSIKRPSGIVGEAFAKGQYSNLWLMQALANVNLNIVGINTRSQVRAASADKATAANASPELLALAAQNTSRTAKRMGKMQFENAGIVSDPTVNPLAYNSLSAMVLGRIIEKVGYENSSPAIKSAFMRSSRAIIGLMGPNGDVSHIGRGQGQVWNLGATADALATAAKYEADQTWRGRFLAGYARVIHLLQTDYTPSPQGMPVVPRHKGEAHPSHKGLERYVSTVGYNGLALNALLHSVNTLASVAAAPNQGIASDYEGVFIDPTQTHFATVRKGNLWYSIHGSTTHHDGRYGFGVMAAQRVTNGIARNIMPHRPYTGHDSASGGPILKQGGKELVPVAQRMSAKADGTISIVGGWSTMPNKKPRVNSNTKMTFKPIGDHGVSFGFRSKGKETYEFEVWGAKGAKVNKNLKSITITEKDGDKVTYAFNRPTKITRTKSDYSSYDSLDRYTVTLKANPGQLITENILFS